MVVSLFNEKFKLDKFPLALNNLYKEEYSSLPLEDLIIIGCNMNLDLTSTDIGKIETENWNLSNCVEWFLFQTGRITASKSRAVCHVKRFDSNVSVIWSICYPQKNSFKTTAIQWGCDYENEALKSYCSIMEQGHVRFKLIRCGLFIRAFKPFVAASPDGLTSCDCCGVGTVEVKCPRRKRCNYCKVSERRRRRNCEFES